MIIFCIYSHILGEKTYDVKAVSLLKTIIQLLHVDKMGGAFYGSGAKLGEKSLTDFVDYLTDFEGNIQNGLENGMVKYLHVNRTAAKWAAKTVVFVFF